MYFFLIFSGQVFQTCLFKNLRGEMMVWYKNLKKSLCLVLNVWVGPRTKEHHAWPSLNNKTPRKGIFIPSHPRIEYHIVAST